MGDADASQHSVAIPGGKFFPFIRVPSHHVRPLIYLERGAPISGAVTWSDKCICAGREMPRRDQPKRAIVQFGYACMLAKAFSVRKLSTNNAQVQKKKKKSTCVNTTA